MFEVIEAENLFSWEKLNYPIRSGISQITGFNYDDNTSEGSGKSSVPNILCWTLYGRIPKDAKVDEVVREGCSGGHGKVHLSDGNKIYRSRKPNDVYIEDANGKVIKGKDAKETQILINNLIGLSFEAFCQIIYFAQNYPNKFTASNEADKAKILSETQDLTIFDKAKKETQDLIKREELELVKLESEHLKAIHEYSTRESNSALLVQFIERFEEDKNKLIQIAQDNKDSLSNRLKKLEVGAVKDFEQAKATFNEELSTFEQILSDLNEKKIQYSSDIRMVDSATREKRRVENSITLLEKSLPKLQERLEKFNSSDKTCPTCGEPVKDHKLDEIFKEAASLEEELKSKNKELASEKKQLKTIKIPDVVEVRKALDKLEEESKEINTLKQKANKEFLEVQRATEEVKQLKKQLKVFEASLQEAKAKECTVEEAKLSALKEQMQVIKKALAKIKVEIDKKKWNISDLEILKVGFKEVKQYVFQSLLAELSRKSTQLASELFEVPVTVEFLNEDDEGTVSKIMTKVTLDGNERSLGLYSGGQYRRIELAVDLALGSIIANRSSKSINFRILDEPMRDLSEASMQKVVELLKKLKGPTLIIEHNSITKAIIENEFNIEYRNGVSRHAS